VLITGVQDGLPAADAGLQQNDLIIRIDGEETPTSPVLRSEISNRTPGEYVTITVVRDGEEQDFRVKLAAAKFLPSGQLVPVVQNDEPRERERPRSVRPF
jgi:S1-C subfamily serine protease